MFVVGFILNTNSPMQNQLPVFGAIIVVVGIILGIWFT